MKHVLSFSGGKDSTAMYLLALELGFDFTPVFADTGHEHELTYDYVRDLPRLTGGPEILWVKADFSEEFERKRRFITEKWVADLVKDVPGQWHIQPEFILRDEDGEARIADCVPEAFPAEPDDPYRAAKTAFFSWVPARKGLTDKEAAARVRRALELLQPTGIPFLDLCMLKGRFPSTRARFCSEELKHHPLFFQVIDPLLEAGHTVISWQGVRAEESERRAKLPRLERLGGGMFNWRPLLRWTWQDVFAIHQRHGIDPNPLYKMGCGRVGCMPCIHARKDEIRNIAIRFPEHVARVEEWERIVSGVCKRGGSTFFSVDKTPGDHMADHSLPMPGIREVVEWSKTGRGGRQYDAFAFLIDQPQCSSLYGLCDQGAGVKGAA